MLATSFLPATLTAKVKVLGGMVGADGLWTQFYSSIQKPTLLFGPLVALATFNTENDLSKCVHVWLHTAQRIKGNTRRMHMMVRTL